MSETENKKRVSVTSDLVQESSVHMDGAFHSRLRYSRIKERGYRRELYRWYRKHNLYVKMILKTVSG